MIQLIEKESRISQKIKKIIKFKQNNQKMSDFYKFSKMRMVSSCLDVHKKCLIDYCLVELKIIFDNYIEIEKFSTSRLLYLKKKLIYSKMTLLKILKE